MDFEQGEENSALEEIQAALTCCQEVTSEILAGKYENLKEMAEAYKERFPSSKCGNFWDEGGSISLTCEECRQTENSCVCLDCFLRQNHEGHHCRISLNSSGNCDCGDASFWKPECFCSEHKGQLENPDSLLEPEEKELFLKSFDKIGKLLGSTSETQMITYLKFLAQFVQFGDPVSRCLAIAISPYLTIDLHIKASYNGIQALFQFEASIINEPYFVDHFLLYLLENMKEFFIASLKAQYDYSIVPRNVFHAYSPRVVKDLLEKHPDDWHEIVIGQIGALIQVFQSILKDGLNENTKFWEMFVEYAGFFKRLANLTQDKDKFTQIALSIAKLLSEMEFNFSFTCKREGDKEDDDPKLQSLMQTRHQFHSLITNIFDFIVELIDPTVIVEYFIKFMKSRDVDYNEIKCAVDTDCDIYVFLTLHIFVAKILQATKKPAEIVNEVAKSLDIPLDDICRILCFYPIRLYAAIYYNEKKFFVRNQDMVLNTLFLIPIYFINELAIQPFFLIQLAAGLMNANKFLELLRGTFSVSFEEVFDSYFLFFTNIIFDRIVYRNDPVEIFDQQVFNFLRQKSLPLKSLLGVCFGSSEIDRVVEIKKFTKMTENKDGDQLLSLINENSFSFTAPWFTTKDTHSLIRSFISKNSTQFLPMKEVDEIEGYHLLSYLHSEEYNNLCKKILISQDTEFSRLALNSLVYERQHPLVQSEEELGFSIVNFDSFIHETDEQGNNLFDFLLNNLGVLGEESLRRMNVGEIPVKEETKNLKKLEAQKRKQAILAQMTEQQNAFMALRMNSSERIESIDTQSFTCPICQINKKMNGEEEEPFGYPVYFIKGPKIENKRRLLFYSCGHLLHMNCAVSDSNGKCPLDRTRFRVMLPQFDENGKLTNSISKQFAQTFLDKIGGLSALIEGIANEIITMELRFRVNPDAVYHANSELLRSLYLLFLHFFDPSKVDELETAATETPLIPQILAANIDESSTFIQCVHDSAWGLDSPLEVFVLCRRAALFSHFCLGNNLLKDIDADWDDILKSPYLSTMFDLSIPATVDSELKPFTFPFNLPKNYLYFTQPPYKFNFGQKEDTYVVLNEEKIALYDRYSLFHHLYKTGNTYAFVLRLSGTRLSTVFAIYNSYYSDLKTIYLNTNGDEDPGLRQGYLLFLSDQRYEQLTDVYLSGQWIINDISY